MTGLLVLRHAQTIWNVEGRLQGGMDSALTQTGLAQIASMRAQLATLDLSGWQWITSPSGRAVETAKGLVPDVSQLRIDARLREIDIGDWQGAKRDALPLPDPPLMTQDGPLGFYMTAPGIEPMTSLRARCSQLLDELKDPSVLVTHGVTSRMLRAVALGIDDANLHELPGGQGQIFHIHDGVQDIVT